MDFKNLFEVTQNNILLHINKIIQSIIMETQGKKLCKKKQNKLDTGQNKWTPFHS